MKVILFLSIFLTFTASALAQEGLFNDIKGCNFYYWFGPKIEKNIRKEKDSSRYFYNNELIIYYNDKKNLDSNTFYVLNHGFNKLVTLTIKKLFVEATYDKDHISQFGLAPEQFLNLLYNDSIARCSWIKAGIRINVPAAKKIVIKSLYVEIGYYGMTFYKWFLRKDE